MGKLNKKDKWIIGILLVIVLTTIQRNLYTTTVLENGVALITSMFAIFGLIHFEEEK